MEEKDFEVIFSSIITTLIEKIRSVYHLDENAAVRQLHRTKFYEYLRREDAKIQKRSIDELFDVYQTEVETGHLKLPEQQQGIRSV